MRRSGLITAALFLLMAGVLPVAAQRGRGRGHDKDKEKEKEEKHEKHQGRGNQARELPRAQENRNAAPGIEQRQDVHDRNAQRKIEQRERVEAIHDRNAERRDRNWSGRVAREEQQRRIDSYERNRALYRRDLEDRLRLADERTARLERERRVAAYRFQRDYYDRLRLQQQRLADARYYDYVNDPYYYTDWSYRYNRGGRTYYTNQYGADLLRQAVNYGYQEGLLAGQADRQDRWRFNFRDSYAYQDADYGYYGRYVSEDEYNYYFREGFRRGYEDGYNSRYQYGRYTDGKAAVIGAVLNTILNLVATR